MALAASASLKCWSASACVASFSLSAPATPVTELREMAELVVSPTYRPRVIANHFSLWSGAGAGEGPSGALGMTV
jgi:hypothetical protein